ncbi:hypothetical protein [Enterococcus sp. DIV1420a]|uniref:hypothetical protein n=1 Tax=Enterococcus sp. DIV1420a TaxID=2774672 RepID=UPI003F26D245
MEEEKGYLDSMKLFPETSPIATYIQLIKWMKKEEINKEDLAIACQIFLLINDKTTN